ncbi:MAG: hypothetical protein QY310_06745 [Candidatus Jettenia sp. CY-1]|nr:MAG: hypothetical protein QY310_06745 [Candidatus Jettenia sp. CY-1]
MRKRKRLRRLLFIVLLFYFINFFVVFGSEVGSRLVDFSLEDLHEARYSQANLEGKITLVVLQSRTTLQTAIDCKTQLKKLIPENQAVQMVAIMDLRKRPSLVPKFALKSKILAQDTTSKEIPFLLDWDGGVTKALGGEDNKCKLLIVDPALKVVYNQECEKAAIESEIKPLLIELSSTSLR